MKAATGSSRGRSASETPTPSIGGESATPAPADVPMLVEDDGEEEEDTKLYCMCETLYDEEKMMIACDKYVLIPCSFFHYDLAHTWIH